MQNQKFKFERPSSILFFGKKKRKENNSLDIKLKVNFLGTVCK